MTTGSQDDFASPDLRKIRFKEIAKEIISRDRDYRKAGVSVDTAGSVARALEKAFKLGQQVAFGEIKPAPKNAAVNSIYMEWRAIPIRSRDALDTIFRYGYVLILQHEPWKGKDAWYCYKHLAGEYSHHGKYGVQTISILIRDNLVEIIKGKDGRSYISPTKYGLFTWKKAMKDRHISPGKITSIWGCEEQDEYDRIIDEDLNSQV